MVYFNVFIICFNVFQCIKKNLNVFINIVIGISPLHSHCNVITMHTHIRICFSLSTMITFLTCYTTTFFSPIFIDLFQFIQFMKRLHINLYFSRLYITPHSIFHVVTSWAEHSRAQVIFKENCYVGSAYSQCFIKDHLLKKLQNL
jgi:hypothetical protein